MELLFGRNILPPDKKQILKLLICTRETHLKICLYPYCWQMERNPDCQMITAVSWKRQDLGTNQQIGLFANILCWCNTKTFVYLYGMKFLFIHEVELYV